MLKFQIALLLTLGLLAGCGQVAVFGHTIGEKRTSSEAKPDQAPTPQANASLTGTPAVLVVKAVTLAFTPQAAAKIASDSNFQVDALLDVIRGELRSRKLLDEADSSAAATAEIAIDEFAVRPSSNAVVFGYILSAGTLSGEILVRHAAGTDLQKFRIDAQSRVSIAASGESKNALAPLYSRFAVLAGDRLAGTASKPPSPDPGHM